MVAHFKTLADDMPLILYNLPALAKNTIGLNTLEKLASHPNILGIKDSSGDLAYVSEASKIMPTFQGDDPLLFASLERGVAGRRAWAG